MSRLLAVLAVAVSTATVATTAAGEPLHIRVETAPGAAAKVPVQLALTAEGGAGEGLQREMTAPDEVSLDLPAGSRWQVAAHSPGYWSKPRVVSIGAGGEQVTLGLWPTGRIRGKVQMAPGESFPREISLRFQPAPGERSRLPIPQASVACPVEERSFACEVPAGVLDLRFRVPGFISRYLWGAEVGRGRDLPAGTIALQRGASVVGWIAAPERDFRFEDCRVELAVQASGLLPSRADLERGPAQAIRAGVGPRGFFQLSGVPAGSYRLSVRHPRFAPAHVAPVPVTAGAETEIERIELHPPVELTVSVSPSTDPFLGRWRLSLDRAGETAGYFAPAAEGTATPEGAWKASGLEPGTYLLTVLDSRESRWVSREVELGPEPLALAVEAKFARVQGTVTLGGEPLAARLWFGGRYGPRRIRAESDQEGKFYAFLPWDPTWDVDVEADEPKVASHLAGLEVEERRGAPGLLDIVLPDTRLLVEVVAEDGKRAARARVRAAGEGPREVLYEEVPDGEGRLELRGLAPGRWLLSGEERGPGRVRRSSQTTAVDIEKGRQATARLVLREDRKITGLVISSDGNGVPGTQVVAVLDAPGGLPSLEVPSAITDVEGRFELDIPVDPIDPSGATGPPAPRGARAPRLTVLPPGFALRQLPPHAPEEGPLTISVDQAGGTVILDGHGEMDLAGGASASALPVLFGRHALWLPLAYSWAQLNGIGGWEGADRLVIPMLEPGTYTACWAGAGTAMSEPPAGRPDLCATGTLAPYGELVLKLPPHGSPGARR